MYQNICTNWQDVREWIADNKLQRYSFRTSKSQDGTRANDVIFAYCADDTPEENLRLCEKRLQNASGAHLYGTGFRSATANTGGCCVEVQYSGVQMMPMCGISGQQISPSYDEDAISARIRKEITREMEYNAIKNREKEIDEKIKAYEAEKASVVGSIISYLSPYIPLLLNRTGLANVAGAGGPVVAERIVPQEAPEQEDPDKPDPDDLPESEAEEVYDLIKRFRKVEPDYLPMLRSVVSMAEAGDMMYNSAKCFLVKK